MEIAGVHIGKIEKPKVKEPNFAEIRVNREAQIEKFKDTSQKINFKIAQLRYITYQSETDQDTKEQARFAAILLRKTLHIFAKSEGITINDDSFNGLGGKVIYDPEKYDAFSGGINPGDEVVIVQPQVRGDQILGYCPEIVHRPQVYSTDEFLKCNLDETIDSLKRKSAEELTNLWQV